MKMAGCETTHVRLQGRANNCADGRGGGKEGGRIWGGAFKFGLIMEQRRLRADMGGQGMTRVQYDKEWMGWSADTRRIGANSPR